MKPNSVAIVGAAETTEMGKVPTLSQIGLHADAALNALADCGLTIRDIDGVATAGHDVTEVVHYLGITPKWVDSTSVGGCSFMLHVRHAAAAINEGLCSTVLITHGESGRNRIAQFNRAIFPSLFQTMFEQPYGVTFPPTRFTIPVMRYMKQYGLTEEQLATVAVVQREWAAMHPRASFRDPITVDDRGTGESAETPLISQMEDFTSSRAFRVSGKQAFEEAGITHADVDHLMIYDAFAHLPIYGLEDLGFVKPGEAGAFIAEGNTRPGGRLPLNTNGGGLSYMHSGMYGMYALQEGVRQMRGVSPAQVEGAEISVVHGVGSMFGAAATIVLTNNPSA